MAVNDVVTVPPRAARAFLVQAGQRVRIVDVDGAQPGDWIGFRADNPRIHFSQARTRVESGRVSVTTGDDLWTNGEPPEPMVRIVADSYGGHDLLYTPCCRYALAKRFAVHRDGCLEHLAAALAPYGMAPESLPDPLNLFFRVSVAGDGSLTVKQPDSPPGSVIEMQARMPCLMAVSTCAVPVPGTCPSAYRITLHDGSVSAIGTSRR